MKVEDKWKQILSIPDSRLKAMKAVNFAFRQVPYGFWWTVAMNEYHRLSKLGYGIWQEESKQNG